MANQCSKCGFSPAGGPDGLCCSCAHERDGLDPTRDYLAQPKDGKKTIAVDFDGVLHTYDKGWQEGKIYGELVPGAAEALRLMNNKYKLVVFTTRLDHMAVQAALVRWDVAQYISSITNKKPIAMAYIDDRAVQFNDWGTALTQLKALLAGKP